MRTKSIRRKPVYAIQAVFDSELDRDVFLRRARRALREDGRQNQYDGKYEAAQLRDHVFQPRGSTKTVLKFVLGLGWLVVLILLALLIGVTSV